MQTLSMILLLSDPSPYAHNTAKRVEPFDWS